MDQQFGSTWEQNVYAVLQERKIPFDYQVSELGGRMPGGTVIDFVVYKPGTLRRIALYVDGPRWHTARREPYEAQKRADLVRLGYEVMVVEDESETLEGAAKWIKDNL